MRLRLAIFIAFGIVVLGLASSALADAPGPITPGPDAVFVADGKPITFSAAPPTPPSSAPTQLDFYISKSQAPVSSDSYKISGPVDANGNYSATSDPDILGKPGTYFWQPVNPDPSCSLPVTPECNGEVRRFVITPLPASAVTDASQVDTFLNKKPRHRTRHRKVKFTFSSNVDGAKFQCLFATGWEKCHSPHVFRHLKVGRYQFEVRAVVNGIEDADPESWIFRVLRRHHH
jgi:hypothetical protein